MRDLKLLVEERIKEHSLCVHDLDILKKGNPINAFNYEKEKEKYMLKIRELQWVVGKIENNQN
jgi:hypothetical protein